MRTIYLDYNATTPVAPAVQQAMLPFVSEHFGNPSSSHAMGRAAHEAVQDSRVRVARLLGADCDEIVFTSGGSESNNLALKGILGPVSGQPAGHLVISAVEHPSVRQTASFLDGLGVEVTVVGCTSHGIVEPDSVASAMRSDTRLVSIMHANNEVGVIQPLAEIAAVCRRHRALFHTDAAQSIGKIRVAVRELGVDLLTVAGHKCYAPKGVGALFVRRGVRLTPLIHGAGHERGLRAGTENVPHIVALGTAASLAAEQLDDSAQRIAALRDRLEQSLALAIGPQLRVHGRGAPRLPNTLSVAFPRVDGSELLRRVPEICASTGAACHSPTQRLSDTLHAMGVTPEVGHGTVRFSLGWYTGEEEIDRAASLLIAAWESARE